MLLRACDPSFFVDPYPIIISYVALNCKSKRGQNRGKIGTCSFGRHSHKTNIFQSAELRGCRGGTPKSGDLAGIAGVHAAQSSVEGRGPRTRGEGHTVAVFSPRAAARALCGGRGAGRDRAGRPWPDATVRTRHAKGRHTPHKTAAGGRKERAWCAASTHSGRGTARPLRQHAYMWRSYRRRGVRVE